MDRFLFEKFTFEMDDELYDNACIAMAKMANDMVKSPSSNKVTFNYYPQVDHRLQLVVEGITNDHEVQIDDVKIHHTSEDVWKLKRITEIDKCDGSYLATSTDGKGLIVVRLVNDQVLDNIKIDDIIEAQVVAFALNIDIYQDEDDYEASIPKTKDNQQVLMKDGLIVASNFIVNNSANLNDEERQSKEHIFDNLVDIRGTITMCYKYPLKMFDIELNNYYLASVLTDFGQIKVIIPRALFPENVNGFGIGNVIVGKVVISGDVCIYNYEKYSSSLNKE